MNHWCIFTKNKNRSKELRQATTELRKMKELLGDAEQRMHTAEKEKYKMEADLKKSQDQLAKLQKTQGDLGEALALEREKTENAMLDSEEKIAIEREETEVQKRNMEMKIDDLEDNVRDLQDERSRLEKTIAMLESERKANQKEIADLQKRASMDSNEKEADMQRSLQDSQQKGLESEVQLLAAQNTIEELQAKLKNSKGLGPMMDAATQTREVKDGKQINNKTLKKMGTRLAQMLKENTQTVEFDHVHHVHRAMSQALEEDGHDISEFEIGDHSQIGENNFNSDQQKKQIGVTGAQQNISAMTNHTSIERVDQDEDRGVHSSEQVKMQVVQNNHVVQSNRASAESIQDVHLVNHDQVVVAVEEKIPTVIFHHFSTKFFPKLWFFMPKSNFYSPEIRNFVLGSGA